MATWPTEQKSNTQAINTLQDQLTQEQTTVNTALTGATTTLTAAQVVGGVIQQSGSNGALAPTLPTAAAIIAQMGPGVAAGDAFDFSFINTNNATVTITTNTGLTLQGTMAIPTNKTQQFRGVVTNVASPAVTIIGLLVAPV